MPDLLADLNEPQRQAVEHADGPLLVLAGAGSGKTRVITRRVARLIEKGIAPWNVLAITFTNKAAEEMAARVAALGVPRGATTCTFHSLCARLLREFAHHADLEPNYSIYDRDDQLKLAKEAVIRADLSTSNFAPRKVHASISNAKNELKTPEMLAAEADGDFYLSRVARVYRHYQKLLAENNALDFDDLLMRTAFILRDRPDVRQMLSTRYRYILIDEYQDTNRAQYILAHGIAMDHENLCATGDPDQSIYAWRGADINNILEFESDYPDATVIRLEENYRSTSPILAAASVLISHNIYRKEKALWTRKEGGADVTVSVSDDEHAEARLVAGRIAQYREAGGDFEDVAIFYRVNSLSRVMEEALLNAGIPYRIARGVEFYNRKEIKDVLAYLRVLANPADDLSLTRIINTPARGIGNTTLKRLAQLALDTGQGLLDACRTPDRAGVTTGPAKKVTDFVELMDGLRADLDRPVRQIVEDVVGKTGLEEALSAEAEEDNRPLSNVGELINTATEFDERTEGEGTLTDYLHQISLVSDADHVLGDAGAVTLMTLHAAKGLEFPAVFVIGCEDGLLPFRRDDEPMAGSPTSPDPRYEEERRLTFVGMTRAKEHLTLSCARRRMMRGRTLPMPESPFLAEIGSDGVHREDHTTRFDAILDRLNRRGGPRRGGFYEEADQRQAIEAMDDLYEAAEVSVPPEYEYLREGCRVHHPTFGGGTVVKIDAQPWPHTRAKVAFDQLGTKTLVLSKARLEMPS